MLKETLVEDSMKCLEILSNDIREDAPLSDTILLYKKRLNTLQHNYNSGILPYADYRTELTRIEAAIIDLIGKIKYSDIKNPERINALQLSNRTYH